METVKTYSPHGSGLSFAGLFLAAELEWFKELHGIRTNLAHPESILAGLSLTRGGMLGRDSFAQVLFSAIEGRMSAPFMTSLGGLRCLIDCVDEYKFFKPFLTRKPPRIR
jgi:hypothetical protein